MTTLLISGPMTGYEDFNRPAFNLAADRLRAAGFTVLNPADNKAPNDNPTWADWMRLALAQLVQADGIALLTGWSSSPGARIEERLACDLGMPRGSVPHWATQAAHDAYMTRLLTKEAKV